MSANHLTGVDERIEIVIGGVLITAFSDVTSFDASDSIDKISYKPLGSSRTMISQDFAGHSGTIVVVDSDPTIEATHQAILNAMVARVPMPINVLHVVTHKVSGLQVTHQYTDVKMTLSRKVARGSQTEVSYTFETGFLRSQV